MQCLQALRSSKLSTSGRQRDRQQEQQQQLPQQSACNIPVSISHDVKSFQIQYPVLGVANIGHEQTGINSGNNSTKKRKAECFAKPKETRSSVTEDSNSKRMKEETAGKVAISHTKQPKNEKKSSGDGSKEKSKPPEADYIHVRARRGQATDSHSLAERVRRERISERMKYLQDLVPGCNKIMGKASMLDEIINYVQSLQRQVEFLSMKLAAVNLISDNSNLFDTGLNSACNSSSMPVIGMSSYQLDLSGFQLDSLQQGHACSGLNVFMNAPVTVADTLDSCLINAHGSSAWGTGLHSFYGVEFQEGRESAFTSQSLQGGNIQSNNLKRDM